MATSSRVVTFTGSAPAGGSTIQFQTSRSRAAPRRDTTLNDRFTSIAKQREQATNKQQSQRQIKLNEKRGVVALPKKQETKPKQQQPQPKQQAAQQPSKQAPAQEGQQKKRRKRGGKRRKKATVE